MDPLQHLSQKLLAERVYRSLQQQQPAPPTTAPPPYTPSETNNVDTDTDTDFEDEDEDEDEDEPTPSSSSSSPIKLTINAAHSIQGSNNLVPTSPTPLADATKFSAVLLAAVKQLNAAAETSTGAKRALKVDLTINCGITVIGDRNVVGNVGLKAKTSVHVAAAASPIDRQSSLPAAAAVIGAKRMAEDDGDEGGESIDGPAAKRLAIDGS